MSMATGEEKAAFVEQTDRIFTRDFIEIFLAAGLMRVCYQMQSTVFPLYGDELGFSATLIGLMTTVCTLSSLILRPLLGGLLDLYGRRKIVLIGTLLFAAATFFCGFTGVIGLLFFLRAVQGVGFSAHTTAVNTMATDILPEKRMAEGIGYMGLTGSVSLAIAPALAIQLSSGGHYRRSFVAAAAAGGVAVVCLLLVRGKDEKHVPKKKKGHLAEMFWEKAAVKPALLMMVLGGCNAGLGTFLAIYAKSAGFTKEDISTYFVVNAVALALARFFGGRISEKMGHRLTMLVCTILCVIAYLMVPLAGTAYVLWIAAFLYGIGYGTIYPMLNAMAIVLSPREHRGTAMATFLTGMDIGIGFGAGIWGVVADGIGLRSMFITGGIVSAAVFLLDCILFRRGREI